MRNVFHKIMLVLMFIGAGISAFSGVRVQFKDNDGTPVSQWMRLEFKIINDGPASYDLANTTLTYFFSDTASVWSTALWSFLINSNQADASTITATVAPEPSLTNGKSLTLKFSSGTISPDLSCWVLVGTHNQVWSVNELDDFSYLPGTVFQDDGNISLYQGDQVLWGPKIFSPIGNGPVFNGNFNPIISYEDRKHYSSDPAVAVIHLANNSSMLYLATSTDLYSSQSCGSGWWPPNWFKSNCGIDWPMDGVHLYTIGDNTLSTQWLEHGNVNSGVVDPVMQLKDFSWANVGAENMFAPDIQYVSEKQKMFMYIPIKGTDGWHIGTASAGPNASGFYDNFTPFKGNNQFSYFNFTNGAGGTGFLIDPGVFQALDGTYYMLYVDTEKGSVSNGNISMAQINDDMVSGLSKGRIGFIPPYNQYSYLTQYLEGPDVSIMHTKNGTPYYYLVFTAGNNSQLIGYAMASQQSFAANQTTCWDFKGWVFQDLGTGNNHADFVEFGDKHYIFYHQGFPDPGNHRRQVCAKEFELDDNGEIIGLTRPSNIADINNLTLYGSLDGNTKQISKGFVKIRDETISDQNVSTIHLSTLENITPGDLKHFKLVYYINIEPGANMALEPDGDLPANFKLLPLRHLGAKIWAAIIECTIPNNSSYVFKSGQFINLDLPFKVHFLGTNGGNSNIKSNDPSQPIGSYTTWTTRIGFFDGNSDPARDVPLCGETPAILQNTTKYLRNAMVFNGDADWSYLTLTGNNENWGINNQFLNTGWVSQEWYVKDVDQNTVVQGVTVGPNVVQLVNLWPTQSGNNYYMTCDNTTYPADILGVNYAILNKSLHNDASKHPDMLSQFWKKELVQGNCYRLKSLWTPSGKSIYLTRYQAGNASPTYGKLDLGSDLRQQWFME